MNDIKDRRTMVEIVTCKFCNTEFEITPRICTRLVNSIRFGVKCPCCQKTSGYHFNEVKPDFWRNIRECLQNDFELEQQ